MKHMITPQSSPQSSLQSSSLPEPQYYVTLKGFSEHILETGISYFGINECANPALYPTPFTQGDIVTLFRDHDHQQLFLQGQLLQDPDRLKQDNRILNASYSEEDQEFLEMQMGPAFFAILKNMRSGPINKQIPYLENPLYLSVSSFDEQAVADYMQENPRSLLAEDLAHDAIVTPPPLLEIFAKELAVIVKRPTHGNGIPHTTQPKATV